MLQRPEFLTLKDVAADYFGGRISPDTVREWIVQGRLRAYRPGRKQVFVSRAELDALLEASTATPYRLPWLDGKRGRPQKKAVSVS
jgi:excisionase family DNA binding protein